MTCHIKPYPQSVIVLFKDIKTILLATCQLVKATKKESFKKAPINFYFEKEDKNAFFNHFLLDNKSFSKKKCSDNKDE